MADNHGPYQQDPFTHIIQIHFPKKKKDRFVAIAFGYRFDSGVIPGVGWNTSGGGECGPGVTEIPVPNLYRPGYITKIRLYRQEHGWNMFWNEAGTMRSDGSGLVSPPWTDTEWNSFDCWIYNEKKKEWNLDLGGPALTTGQPEVPADPEFGAWELPGYNYDGYLVNIDSRAFDVTFETGEGGTNIKHPDWNEPASVAEGGPGVQEFAPGTSATWVVYGQQATSGPFCAAYGPFIDPATPANSFGSYMVTSTDYDVEVRRGGVMGDLPLQGGEGPTLRTVSINFSAMRLFRNFKTYTPVAVRGHRKKGFIWILFDRTPGKPWPAP